MGTSCYAPLETSELLPILKNQKQNRNPLSYSNFLAPKEKKVSKYFEALAELRNHPQRDQTTASGLRPSPIFKFAHLCVFVAQCWLKCQLSKYE